MLSALMVIAASHGIALTLFDEARSVDIQIKIVAAA